MSEACTNCGMMLEDGQPCPQCVHPAGKFIPGDAPIAMPLIQGDVAMPLLQPDTSITVPDMDEGLRGIEGWLILVAIQLATILLRLLYIIFGFDVLMLVSKTDPSAIATELAFRPLLLEEAAANSLLLLYAIVLNFFFYKTMKAFSPNFIVFLIIALGVRVFDEFVFTVVEHQSQYRDIVIPLISAGVWIAYTLVSRRVKLTFVD
jgi:hypothetical protein